MAVGVRGAVIKWSSAATPDASCRRHLAHNFTIAMKRRRSVNSMLLFVFVFVLIGAGVAVAATAEPKVNYDGKVLEVPMGEKGSYEMINHWTDQAYSGLFAAVAAKKLHEVSPEAQEELTQCSKNAKDAYQHATCVSRLLKLRDSHSGKFGDAKRVRFESAFRQAATPFVQAQEALRQTAAHASNWHNANANAFVQAENSEEEENGAEFVPIRNLRPKRFVGDNYGQIVQRTAYDLRDHDAHLSPLGAVAKMLLKNVVSHKNKTTDAHSWQQAVHRIRTLNKKRRTLEEQKKMQNQLPFDPESTLGMLQKFAYRAVGGENKLNDIDPENPDDMMKFAQESRKKNAHDPMRRLLDLVRDGVKLGYGIAGQNTTNFENKTLKVISPRFFSVVPDDDDGNTTNLLSPSLFSLHNKGKGVEQMTSLPSLVHGFNAADQQEWLNLIVEAAGVDEQAEKLEAALTEQEHNQKLEATYEKEVRGKNGQPLFFTKQNVSAMYGSYEERKITVWEHLISTYSKEQLKEMNATGYTNLRPEQLQILYGPSSPFNDSKVLEKLLSVPMEETHALIERDIHRIADQMRENHRRGKRAIILSPIVKFPVIYAAPLLNQAIILSPLVFSPIVGTPAVLGPIILSPWVFIPLILSPRVLSPLILTPLIFSPIVLSPLVLHPLILVPGIFNPIVLTPLVLSPFILSPQVFTPVILSPLVLNPLILNPMVGSPLVLSPFVLSPLILSPQALFAVVLSPYALSPLVASKLFLAEVILSPSWLS